MISVAKNVEITFSGEDILVLRNVCEFAKQHIKELRKLGGCDEEHIKEIESLMLEVFDA